MIHLNRKNIFVSLIAINLLFTSCKNHSEENISLDEVAFILKEDVENEIQFFHTNIMRKQEKLTFPNRYEGYKEISDNYFKYLEGLKFNSSEKADNPFFTKEKITNIGKEYLEISAQYLAEIDQLFSDEYLSVHLKSLLGLMDVETEDGVLVQHIYYSFYGLPKDFYNYKIDLRKRNVLILQNEILSKILQETRN